MPTVSVKLHFAAKRGKENTELSRVLLGLHLNVPDFARDHYRVLQSMGGDNIGEAEFSISDDGEDDGALAAAEPAPDLDEPISIPKHGGFDPDDMSEKRIGWGGNAVAGIMRDTGTDIEDALSDLLADLMHWSHANGQDFAEELRRAVGQFSAETSEGGGW